MSTKRIWATILFQIALALLCAVAATGVHGAPDADPAYRTYPEKIHKYGYTRSKLVLPYRRPWTYGGPTSPYTPGLYDSDTFARRHYGGLRSFRDGTELCECPSTSNSGFTRWSYVCVTLEQHFNKCNFVPD